MAARRRRFDPTPYHVYRIGAAVVGSLVGLGKGEVLDTATADASITRRALALLRRRQLARKIDDRFSNLFGLLG